MKIKTQKQSGTILITTLLLLAVVTIIAVGMTERNQIDIKRTSLLLTSQQAYYYNKAAEVWAVENLKLLPLSITKETLMRQWPLVMTPIAIPGGVINATLYDAQGELYNLNNLSDTTRQAGFIHFLNILAPDQKNTDPKFLMAAILSWVSRAGQETDILSDQYYLGLHPPYRAAHQLFVSPSELRLVKGMTAETYSRLQPYLIALPEPTPMNVNSANQAVLIFNGFSVADAQAIIAIRQQKGGFKTTTDFSGLPLMQNRNLLAQSYSTESNYFLLETNVLLKQQKLTVYTLFKRTKDNTKKVNMIKILWQTRGTL